VAAKHLRRPAAPQIKLDSWRSVASSDFLPLENGFDIICRHVIVSSRDQGYCEGQLRITTIGQRPIRLALPAK